MSHDEMSNARPKVSPSRCCFLDELGRQAPSRARAKLLALHVCSPSAQPETKNEHD